MEEDKYAVKNNVIDNVIETILTIYNATQEDFGVYTCTMENNLGSDKKDILLIDKGKDVEKQICAIINFLLLQI